ncbi:hypothetical protein KEJ51_01975 [Candidatus Bathyarchaeota archaeon]|nr:hypothetical protein [Candidatus Bathyarchaeota archaeon]
MKRPVMIMFALMLMFSSILVHLSFGFDQPEGASVERIAGYSWYHWRRAGSDSCIIWLGGGKVTPTYVTVNPYILESLNTMRFIQDLSSRYGLIALAYGEVEYRVDSRLVSKLCLWIRSRGYKYAFAVGYSTGGMALAYELAFPDVADSSPDGAVIISSMVDWREMAEKYKTSSGVELYTSARYSWNVRRSILLIYGELAWFWKQGEEYYKNLPRQRWINGYWFFKEWRLMKGVEHEVFTLEKDGTYDPKPFVMIVDFLDRIRASHLKNFEPITSKIQERIGNLKIDYPKSARSYTLIQLSLKIPCVEGIRIGEFAVYDLDEDSFVTVANFDLSRCELKTLELALAKNQTTRNLQAILFAKMGGEVEILDSSQPLRISVVESPLLRVETGVPRIDVTVDGKRYLTDGDGTLEVYLSGGRHVVELPVVIRLSDGERLLFTSWGDGVQESLREVYLYKDGLLEARYRIQYLLEVTSDYGTVEGAGWYDENSTALIRILLDKGDTSIKGVDRYLTFQGWNDDPESSSLTRKVYVNEPKSVKAIWMLRQEDPNMIWLFVEASISISIATFTISILILRKTSPRV